MSSFIESLEAREMYRRPFVSTFTREWVADAADSMRREQADVKFLAREHRAAVAAAAGAGKTLIAANRQALRDALAAGDTAAADVARAKLDADRTTLRARLAGLREAARDAIGEERAGLRNAHKDLAWARRAYDYELANPRAAARREAYGGSSGAYTGAVVTQNFGYTGGAIDGTDYALIDGAFT